MDNKKYLYKKLDEINQDLETTEKKLIKALETVGLEYIDLDNFILLKNTLLARKHKIQYLIAIEVKKDN